MTGKAFIFTCIFKIVLEHAYIQGFAESAGTGK